MKHSLRDKIALIYTSAGSQQTIADAIGVSRQTIGRYLHAPEHGGYAPNSAKWKDHQVNAMVDLLFMMHKDVVKSQAKSDGLEYDAENPVFYQRLTKSNGEKGDKIAADHTHWLSNEQRTNWLAFAAKSKQFFWISARSTVNVAQYAFQAMARYEMLKRYEQSPRLEQYADAIMNRIIEGKQKSGMYTARTYVQNIPIRQVVADIEKKLITKHEPATGEPGTALADRFTMQARNGIEQSKSKPSSKAKAKASNSRRTRRK